MNKIAGHKSFEDTEHPSGGAKSEPQRATSVCDHKPPANENPPRVLIIRRRYLGDIALLGSVFKNLRLHWPKAQIALLAEHAYAPVGALHADLDRVRSFPRKFTQWPHFIRELRRTHFTHVLDFDNSDKTALVTRLTAAPVRVTYEREDNPIRQRWAYTATAKISAHNYHSQHITETYLALLTEVGIPICSREICLSPSRDDQTRIQKFARPTAPSTPFSIYGDNSFGHNFGNMEQRAHTPKNSLRLLVHPGSRSRFRLWPVERFAAVCDRLQDELDARVFLVAGPGERATAQAIRDAARSHLVLIDETLSIGEFAALCQHFDLMLCHDSGPMHIAAGVGTPVVALYGSQNTAIWSPSGEGHHILQAPLPSTGVQTDSYRDHWVRKLSIDEVYDAVVAAARTKL